MFSLSKVSWMLLSGACIILLLCALSFQHIFGLEPCIKCIYQRMAVIGILIASILPLLYNHISIRCVSYCLWGFSAFKGLQVAREHLALINSTNPFMAICDIVPNFPSFAPLHEWFPAVFAAPGDCLDDTWQFLGLGMINWMVVIFTMFLVALSLVIFSHFYRNIKD